MSALHVDLSKLRSLLGGLLVLDTAGYALIPGEFELDVWRFDALVEQAKADPGRAGPLLVAALRLFRGEPLCDVASEGSVAQWRRALDDKRLQAISLRLEADLARGAAAELVAELERLVAEHPFEERLWGQLMLALYRCDRQADALEAYQRSRRLFAVELGREPGEPLGRLQGRILDRDPTLQPPAPTQVRAGSTAAGSALPRPLTRLIGRERELDGLALLIADPDVRIITLTGPGGVGKTRLLLELARRQEPGHADGAVFVRLERLTDPALVAAEIATALARRDGTDGVSGDGLSSYLRDRELLIAVDNFEHLLAAAPLIAELLEAAERIRVLVSSRTVLRIRGERTFEVQPLGLPAGESAAAVAQSPAVQLFIQCALAADRRLQIDPATTQTVASICRALDGLPLAIELAASRAHSLTPAEIAEQLAQPLSIGEHALRDLPDRQQTLQATIRWSYDLLGPDAPGGALRGRGVPRTGNQEALATATGNLFGQALNARDRAEMKRLRPTLLALITPETSIKALGWIHYFLALDAYVDGRLEPACEHALLSADKAEAIGHEFMLASAVGTRLLAQSARDGAIGQAELARALELMRRPSVQPLAAFALWFVARYAAGVAPETAGRWLVHAQRATAGLDSELWPECILRDETMELLGIADLGRLRDATPPLDHAAALGEAVAWLAQRDPAERAPRPALVAPTAQRS